MMNLKAVLEASGTSLANVLRTTCFLKDLGDFGAFNEVYASYFDSEPPARSTVQVAKLPLDVLVEIDCVALIPWPCGSGIGGFRQENSIIAVVSSAAPKGARSSAG